MKNNWLVTILIAVIVGGAAFFGGMQYQKSQTPRFGGGQFAGAGANGQFARRFGQNGSAVRGQITSADANSITVQLRDGSSKIINISGSTNITKAAAGSIADLKTGEQVVIFGTSNSDGSVNAQVVQLNPMMMRGATIAPTQ